MSKEKCPSKQNGDNYDATEITLYLSEKHYKQLKKSECLPVAISLWSSGVKNDM